MTCGQSDNVVCKHRSATLTFYLDLNERLPAGVLLTSAAASTEDGDLSIDAVQLLNADFVVQTAGNSCQDRTLIADRAIVIVLSGGVQSDDEVIVTVTWVQDDGDTDALDCRVLIT